MQGDELSETSQREGWGLVSPVGDRGAMTSNILRLAGDDALRSRMRERAGAASRELTWTEVARPLVDVIGAMERPSAVERARRRVVLAPGMTSALGSSARRSMRGTPQ
jgi:hypothetical protein